MISDNDLRRIFAPLMDSAPPPIEAVTARAAAIHRRRRWKQGAAIAGVSIAAAVIAAAGPVHLFGYTSDASPPVCGAIQEMGTAFETRAIDAGELPEQIRLSWNDTSVPPPRSALARVEEHPCAGIPTLRLLDIEGQRVVRSLEIATSPVAVSHDTQQDRFDMERINDPVDGWRSFWAPGDGFAYAVTGLGVTRAEMRDVLAAVQPNSGAPQVGAWSRGDEFEVAERADVPSDGTKYSWRLSTEAVESNEAPLATLTVSEDTNSLLTHAYAGDRLTTISGEAALQSVDGTITWIPSPGVVATMSGSGSPEQLRNLASSVGTVSSAAFASLDD